MFSYSISEGKPCWKESLPKGTKTSVNIEHFAGTPAYIHYKGRPIRIHTGEHLRIDATTSTKGREARQLLLDFQRYEAPLRPPRVLPRCRLRYHLFKWISMLKVKHHHLSLASGLTVEEELWMDSSEIPNPGPQDQTTRWILSFFLHFD